MIYLFTKLFTYLFIYLFAYLLIYLLAYSLVYLFIYLLIYLLVYLLVYLLIHLLTYLFIYLTHHSTRNLQSLYHTAYQWLGSVSTLAAIVDASHPQLVLTAAVASIDDDEEATVMSMFNLLDWVYDNQPTYWSCLPTLNCHACMWCFFLMKLTLLT